MIGVNVWIWWFNDWNDSEPFAVNGRALVAIVHMICDWNEPLALHHHSPPFSDQFVCLFPRTYAWVGSQQQTREWRSIRWSHSPWIVNVHASRTSPWINAQNLRKERVNGERWMVTSNLVTKVVCIYRYINKHTCIQASLMFWGHFMFCFVGNGEHWDLTQTPLPFY